MSVIRSVRNSIAPIHKEGYPFILGFLAVSIILGLFFEPLFWIGIILTVWCMYFFRDPERVSPMDSDFVLSPADGKISWVGPFCPPTELGLGQEEMLRISVFMNVFSVHVNRMPMDGTVKNIVYRPGEFANAELDKASDYNERNSLVVDTKHGKIAIVQIAGLVARRILCWTREEETVQAGERFGLIRFGSRLDVYLPMDTKILVGVGQKAVAGETVLASFKEGKNVEDFSIS